MSHLALKQAKARPLIDVDGADESYPRHLVVLGILAFCLSFWAAVVFAAMRFG
jgi:hypothetical protein